MAFDYYKPKLAEEPINVALNAAIERAAATTAELPRPYLGASSIGDECMRRIQYDWWCKPELPARTREIFDRGHYFEERARRLLVATGFKFARPQRLLLALSAGLCADTPTVSLSTVQICPELMWSIPFYGNTSASRLRAGEKSSATGLRRSTRSISLRLRSIRPTSISPI